MYKIFLVEDDSVIANQVEKHLRSWNYEVFIAENFHDIMSDFTIRSGSRNLGYFAAFF